VVGAAPDVTHRSMIRHPAAKRTGTLIYHDNSQLPLTGLGAWASVIVLAGIMR
jgi:hypothetical protein